MRQCSSRGHHQVREHTRAMRCLSFFLADFNIFIYAEHIPRGRMELQTVFQGITCTLLLAGILSNSHRADHGTHSLSTGSPELIIHSVQPIIQIFYPHTFFLLLFKFLLPLMCKYKKKSPLVIDYCTGCFDVVLKC